MHPIAIHRRTNRWRIAYVDPTRRDFRLVYRFESWVQLISEPAGRADLRPIAAALTAADPAPGDWIANSRKTFLAWLRRRQGESAMEAKRFIDIVVEGLRDAPITWSPYDPRDELRAASRRGPGY